MGSTVSEKILARASGRQKVSAGEYVTCEVDLAMVNDGGMFEVYDILNRCGIKKIFNPDNVVCVLDHWFPSPTERMAERHKQIRKAIDEYHIRHFYSHGDGVAHNVLIENGHILPGQLIVGSDSHTATYGALGAAGAGIGFTEMAHVFATGELWFRVPETIKFTINGNLQDRVTAKDVILFIAGKHSTEFAQYKAIEYYGDTVDKMNLSSRITISNMSVELGAKFTFMQPTGDIIDYIRQRTNKQIDMVPADSDASYVTVCEENVSDIEPQVAIPDSIDNVKPVSELLDTRIDQAVLGSCTNGSLDDLRIAAEIMKGKKVKNNIRMLVIPASAKIYKDAIGEGVISDFIDSGAIIGSPGCGPCFGANMGLLASQEVCISSTNRNLKGRMGSPEAKIYLASPATVAASAINGKITDPRQI